MAADPIEAVAESAPEPASEPVPVWRRPDRAWFARPGLEVARDLLGARLTRRAPDGDVTLRITEVEAYQGEQDPGSHAFRGPSARNQVMFEEAGRLYVYRHLGLHTCMNIVCGPAGEAAAVLLRAGEVVGGAPLARRRRLASGAVTRSVDLARGPARLTVALGVTMADYGLDLTGPETDVVLEVPVPVPSPGEAISSGPRVGVSGAGGDGALFPWRLWLTGDPAVSAYRAPAPPRSRSDPRSR